MNEAIAAQIRAARPTESTWVSANAGSGKTRVLTDRVARLLLAGTDPARILCLTYTKAAAAEMQTRLFATLGAWAMLDDDALVAALDKLEPGTALAPEALARARTLFARALETPGGLKIQTIHAFCEALLRRFPLEAGVSPQFRVLDDREAKALRADVLDTFATEAPGEFAAIARRIAGDDPDPLLLEIARHRAAFAGDLDPEGLARALGAEPGMTSEALLATVVTDEARDAVRHLLPLLSGKSEIGTGDELAAALALIDPEACLDALEAALLLKDGDRPKAFPAKGVRTSQPDLAGQVRDLAERVIEARERRLAHASHVRSLELNRFGRRWLAAWAGRKRRLGLLDFDDMIDRAQALLETPGIAAWVLWKLDGGLDHILVDEAQDTSPAQWRVISAIATEFFEGASARPEGRTLFVVGDEKQSIYSFQGAERREFEDKSEHYTRVLSAIGKSLDRCDLIYSFRSARPVLELVDAVFGGPAGTGLSGRTTHRPIDPDVPGRVELWPFLPKAEREKEAEWHLLPDPAVPDDPVSRLAERIAATVAGWLAEGRLLPGEVPPRPIRAGDVLILVQRRGPIFAAVIRALKRARVPVAGADLLRIGGELAVRDLLAGLRVAATPRDDLSLAAFLRSPLGGVGERELFELAHGRERGLWEALRAQPPERWSEARSLLDDIRGQADYLRPFELLERMLIRHGGRARIVARLGAEAEDGIDALLDQALAYEQVEAPSLTGFLDWIDQGEVAVKRRSDSGADEVRVMTVHGAKGLEAPIVFLPDTAVRSEGGQQPLIVRVEGGWPVWRGATREGTPAAVAAADEARKQLLKEENLRLLYVALTRAKRHLVVCGAGAASKPDSWHGLVEEAMRELGAEAVPDGEGEQLSLSHGWTDAARPAAAGPTAAGTLPAWARAAAARPAERERIISPSALGGEAASLPASGSADDDPEAARARGTAIHRLLEHLHGVPAAARADLAARLLPADRAAELLPEAAAVLDAPELGFLFGEGSLAEVEITAPIRGGRILGRIDRLVVGAGRVLAVDFKSNRAVPERPEDIPEGILRQLGAYRAALAPIWPAHWIGVAVLWTSGVPRLMEVPDDLVDAAFARVAV